MSLSVCLATPCSTSAVCRHPGSVLWSGRNIGLGCPGIESVVLKMVLGRKGREVAGDWRKLHDEELHALCSSPNNTGGNRIVEDGRSG